MAKSPVVWVVVLNWNGLADTLACLHSLRALRYTNRRIVVVDNGSTDGSVVALRALASDRSIDLVESDTNLGYAGGNNLGIGYALDRGADFILVLNNDATADSMLLDELLGAAERYPEAGCFGPWIFYMHDPKRLWFAKAEWSSDSFAFTLPGMGQLATEVPAETTGTDYVCGAALFFRANVVRQVGLLDERYFLVYEESDWCYRARRAGFGCLTVPAARVWHNVSASFGGDGTPLRTYFSTRNKLLWGETHVSRREFFGIARRIARRLYPRFVIDRRPGIPTARVWLWAYIGFIRDVSRMINDPLEVARRRAVADYVLRRFGDCPPKIRALTKAWVAARSPTTTPGNPGN